MKNNIGFIMMAVFLIGCIPGIAYSGKIDIPCPEYKEGVIISSITKQNGKTGIIDSKVILIDKDSLKIRYKSQMGEWKIYI